MLQGRGVGRKYQTKGKDRENDKRLSLALKKEQATEQRQIELQNNNRNNWKRMTNTPPGKYWNAVLKNSQ